MFIHQLRHIALRLSGPSEAASVCLHIVDRQVFHCIPLFLIVFGRFQFGPERVVEPVDHVEHGASH